MQYSGGKSKTAKHLAEFMLANRGDARGYLEPFVGGGSVFALMAPHFEAAVANDYSLDLVLLWRALAEGWVPPTSLSEEEYAELRHAEPSALRAFAGFGCSFGAKWFGGYACGASSGKPRGYAGAAGRGLEKKRASFAGAETILQGDYRSLLPWIGPQIMAYCDPPYANTLGYAAAGAFDSDAFWQTVREWSALGARVFVSEYTAPDDMACVWEKPRRMDMASSDGSKHGEVRALSRTITYASGITRTYAPRMMDQKPQKNGRRLVNLSAGDGTNRQTHVSILVLEAFQGARPAGKEAAHRNDNGSDDRLGNLHWATHQENCDERAQNGKDADARKTHCVNGHPFAGENLKFRSDKPGKVHRVCITCQRKSQREGIRRRRADAKAARQSED